MAYKDTLMNMTTTQLVEIILRKDEVERNLRRELKTVKRRNAHSEEAIGNDSSINNESESINKVATDSDEHQFIEELIQSNEQSLRLSRDRWRIYALTFLTITIIQFAYIML